MDRLTNGGRNLGYLVDLDRLESGLFRPKGVDQFREL